MSEGRIVRSWKSSSPLVYFDGAIVMLLKWASFYSLSEFCPSLTLVLVARRLLLIRMWA